MRVAAGGPQVRAAPAGVGAVRPAALRVDDGRPYRGAMSSAPWTWTYADADGADVTPPSAPTRGFPTQADAESWVGEAWHELLDQGVDSVTLLEGDTRVYGPMSLRPAE